VHVDIQVPLEADADDIQVALGEGELALQRHFGLVGLIQRGPQQFAQARNHAPHAPRIAFHQRRYGVQRVEQEVRVQLHAQCRQPRIGQLRLQLRGLGLQPHGLFTSHLVAPEVVAGETGRQYRDEDDEFVHEPHAPQARHGRHLGDTGVGE